MLRLGKCVKKTKRATRTLTPKWNSRLEMPLPPVLHDQPVVLEFLVWDRSSLGREEFLGRCSLDLRKLAGDAPRASSITFSDWLKLKGDGRHEIEQGEIFVQLSFLV